MQFSLLTLLAAAGLAAAAPQADPTNIIVDPRRAAFHAAGAPRFNAAGPRAAEPEPAPQDSGCSYIKASYMSMCARGDNLFCSGNTNVCGEGITDSFDAEATKQNEGACEGLQPGTGCMQTIRCCKS